MLLDALGATGDLRELAVQQLTEDRVKVQAAEELRDRAARGRRSTPGSRSSPPPAASTLEDVMRVLEARGIDRQTMNDFVESGLLWREVVGTRFRARAMPTEADLDAALELRGNAPQRDDDPRRDRAALRRARRGRDRRARRRALPPARRAARASPRWRASTAAARPRRRAATLEPMPGGRSCRRPSAARCCCCSPGQVTRPVPISGGLAIIKLVVDPPGAAPSRRRDDDPEAREALRQQLFTERITSFGQGYLQELLGDALIVER